MESNSTVQISKSLEQRIAREFRKSFFQDWDGQFFIILGFTLLIEIVVVFFLSRQPIPEYSEKEITRIQERFANFVLGEEVITPPEEVLISSSEAIEVVSAEGVGGSGVSGGGYGGGSGGTGTGSGSGGGGGGGGGEGAGTGVGGGGLGTSMSAMEARRQSREAISREVSNKGLLGLLTGSGSAVEGEAVSSLFGGGSGGEIGVGEDLDRVLASASGLKTQGTSGLGIGGGGGGGGGSGGEGIGGGGGGGEIRGGRSGEIATIDDLVSDLSSVSSQSLSRRGEILVEAPTEVVGGGTKSVYRSPEAMYEVMYSHRSAITYCYERELKKIPDLKGKISVRITVSSDGSVKGADIVSSTLNNESAERCILARIRLWDDFQPIDVKEGDVTFRQVYTFGY